MGLARYLTSIMLKLLRSKLVFSAGNYTCCNVRPSCVLYYTELKLSSVCLNMTAEKMYFVSEIINDYTCNYTGPMW